MYNSVNQGYPLVSKEEFAFILVTAATTMNRIYFIALLFAGQLLTAQNFSDGFESSDLSDWVLEEGNANLVTDTRTEGAQSCRLYESMNGFWAYLIHRSFDDNFGTYTYDARADGDNSDADFIFQYQDRNNYYLLSHKPSDTDNPELLLHNVVNGTFQELYNGPAIAARGDWISVEIERICNGDINVTINNRLIISVNDIGIMETGAIGLRSWGQFSYFDDITFEPDILSSAGTQSIMACTGSGFAFGTRVYTEDGVYQDTVMATSGCDSIVTIDLEFTSTITIDTSAVLCIGDIANIGDLQYTELGLYSDTLTSLFGCDSIVNASITSTNPTSLELGSDRSLCPGESITLSLSNFDSYLWSDGTTGSSIIITEPGSYSVEVIDANKCTLIDDILVTEGCNLEVGAANIFSPNDDMINDTWAPTFNQAPFSYQLSIFDRYGSLVFSGDDPSQSWDGRLENEELSSGVYVWRIQADNQSFWGDVILLR